MNKLIVGLLVVVFVLGMFFQTAYADDYEEGYDDGYNGVPAQKLDNEEYMDGYRDGEEAYYFSSEEVEVE